MTKNKQKQYQEFTKVQAGISSQIPAKTSVNLGGKAWTQAALLQVFTTATAAIDDVDEAAAQLRQLVTSQASAIQAAHDLYLQLEQWADVQFGKQSPVLVASHEHGTPVSHMHSPPGIRTTRLVLFCLSGG
ncbi:MAG: hypothetical protein ACYDCL_07865, partial [Myxococcales bacterium]